jgi:hypothetical protein
MSFQNQHDSPLHWKKQSLLQKLFSSEDLNVDSRSGAEETTSTLFCDQD